MKKIIFFCFLLLSCNSKTIEVETVDNTTSTIDSLIQQSKLNSEVAQEASSKSDSAITGKVEKTVKKIQKMENEIKQLKEENNELKKILYDIDNDRGEPYIIRTISDYEDY